MASTAATHARGEENTAKNASPLRIDLPAAVRGQRRPDQRVMVGQHLRVTVAQPPEQRSGALDVGEQERKGLHPHSVEDRPGGGLASGHAITSDPLTDRPRPLTGPADPPEQRGTYR